MPRLDLDLRSLQAARARLQEATVALRALDRQLAADRAALDAAEGDGESPNVTVPIRQRIVEASAKRADLARAQRDLSSGIDTLANGLLREQDPSAMVATMDGQQPIALLPMRIETRYVEPGRVDRLRIRVYPDDLNTIEHEPALTAAERQAGTEYWTARFEHRDDDAARTLRDLTQAFGRGRAAWVVRVMTPLNAVPEQGEDAANAAPEFPPAETVDARAKATRAVLLPDRWCAIGYAAGRREVFRIWGSRIPDELLLSPDWLSTGDPEALLGGERAWLVDFDAALAKGMALEVTQADVNSFALRHHSPKRFDLARETLERLVVVGLEWTRSADDSAADLADLLAAHRDSSGLGFVPLGTPTNNTEVAPAGYSPAHERVPPEPATAAAPGEQDALQLLGWAFGLGPDALAADNIANAHLSEQRTALHMINALWRGTFGQYLLEQWNLPLDDNARLIKRPAIYVLRQYALRYLRPGGALPLLRVHAQPYGILPIVGRRFVDPGGSPAESAIGKVIDVLRPMWEIASAQVPLLKDGEVVRAQQILQTLPWSQAAFYRDKAPDRLACKDPIVLGNQAQTPRDALISKLLAAFGIGNFWQVPISCKSEFLPDDVFEAGYLAGVPWVLADAKEPAREAAAEAVFGAGENYIADLAALSVGKPAQVSAALYRHQSGRALLEALLAYSVQKEQGDAAETYALRSAAIDKVVSLATTRMPYVEDAIENEAIFTVQTHKELMNVSIPALTGAATLGDHVSNTFAGKALELAPGPASRAAIDLVGHVAHIDEPTRDLGSVKLSLDYLKARPIGELNIAFRTTLDCFSYRLDAWISARAHRRLDEMRQRKPTGCYVGGYAWVENLKADDRPASEGYLLAPSPGQAASAAILRSGFMANREQGAFDIALDSQRTRRALDVLQGLTRDQPLAALYGYRIERGLRDALLGKFIWPMRIAFPWRPAGADPNDEPKEAIGARDVVDGVALLDAWRTDSNAVRTRLGNALVAIGQPVPTPQDLSALAPVMAEGLDLIDSVADLLLAEGTHQIVQGNLERAGVAMSIVDKQALPIEPQVNRTPRGGASYTQRLVVVCPPRAEGWPEDRRSAAEPAVNAWLAHMLGDPARYLFSASVHRIDPAAPPGAPAEIVDAHPIDVAWADLGLSPLSAVLMATAVSVPRLSGAKGQAETGFRSALVAAFTPLIVDPASVVGLDIPQQSHVAGKLGLGHFEALATTLRQVLDKARPATRKDLVRPDDKIEKALQDAAVARGDRPDEGEYPGVDRLELEARAKALADAFVAAGAALLASVGADALLSGLAGFTDLLPRASWPAEVLAIDAPGADPALRDLRATAALPVLAAWFEAKKTALAAGPVLPDDAVPATHAQLVQWSIDRIRLLLGKDFPVLPQCSLGPYAGGFDASLGQQVALTVDDGWRVTGWLAQVARVREGADRFTAALSAHEALCTPARIDEFKVVQFPHRDRQVWAALPEAWQEDAATPFDPKQVPEELHDYLQQRPGVRYKDIHRVAPDLALALHVPGGLDSVDAARPLAALVCDEWPEFIPDPFQTAGIGFHFDAPGARPPQSILLALPPRIDQDAWSFDDVIDVIHEAF
ncbi:MAG: hypothetical protein ABIV63_13985, partial [Caldimonas sp.]